jgi:hypothetical protein
MAELEPVSERTDGRAAREERRADDRVGGEVPGPWSATFNPPQPDYGALPQWVASLHVERVLCVAMFACVAWSLALGLSARGLPSPQILSVVLVATAVYAAGLALGGRHVGRNLRRYTEYGVMDWVLLLVPILLVLKLLPYLLQGPGAVVAEVASWLDDPVRFWDVPLVWSLILVFFVWDEALRAAEDLSRLSLQPGELPPPASTPAYHDWLSSPYRFVDHTGAWRRLMWRFVIGGFIMLVFTGLAFVDPERLSDPNRPEVGGLHLHVLLYYLLGFVLAAQTSLDRLRTGWLRAGAVVQTGLASRWLGYGAGLVLASLLLALLLPTSFTPPDDQSIISWLLFPLRLLFGAFNWLLTHLAALVLTPLTWLVPRGVGPSGAAAGARDTPPPLLPGDGLPAPGGPTWTSRLVFALLLYVLPAALTVYAVWNTWRKRHAIIQGLRSFWKDALALVWGAVLELLAVLWRLFSFGSPRLLSLAPEAIQARLRRRRQAAPPGGGARGWLRLRGLGPRELIQYFYVSLVQRAAALGWARGKGQTAYEYSRQLADRLPEGRRELETLTEAFVRAKYSPRPIDETEARRVRGPWQRLRASLQARRRAQQVAGWFGLGRD